MKLSKLNFLHCFRWWKALLWWIQSLLCWQSSEWRRTAWTFLHHWYTQYWVSAPFLQFQQHFLYLRTENRHQTGFRKQVYVASCLREARLCHMAINSVSEVFWKLVETFAYSNRCDLGTENTGSKQDAFCVPPVQKEKELRSPSGLNMNSSISLSHTEMNTWSRCWEGNKINEAIIYRKELKKLSCLVEWYLCWCGSLGIFPLGLGLPSHREISWQQWHEVLQEVQSPASGEEQPQLL